MKGEVCYRRADELRAGDRIVWQRGLTQLITHVERSNGGVLVTYERPMISRYDPDKAITLRKMYGLVERVLVVDAPERVSRQVARGGRFRRLLVWLLGDR